MKTWPQNVARFGIDTYEVRPREDHHGVDLISDVLPFRHLLYLEVREAVDYAKFYSHSRNAVIRVYDAAGNVIETYQHTGDEKMARRTTRDVQTHRRVRL